MYAVKNGVICYTPNQKEAKQPKEADKPKEAKQPKK